MKTNKSLEILFSPAEVLTTKYMCAFIDASASSGTSRGHLHDLQYHVMSRRVMDYFGDLPIQDLDVEKVIEFLNVVLDDSESLSALTYLGFFIYMFEVVLFFGDIPKNPCENFQEYLKGTNHQRLYSALFNGLEVSHG